MIAPVPVHCYSITSISLTCVLCNVLEYIVASSMAKHFTELNILYDLQHGFREKRSCEMQLIMLVDELAKNMQMGKHSDLILLGFGKAFNKVTHETSSIRHQKRHSKMDLRLFG